MKRKIAIVCVMVFVFALMSGCCLVHDWESATCTTAQTCSKCGETEGEALGHVWLEATCESAKVCSTCGEAEGEALGHALTEANYQEAAKCTVCGDKVGEPLQADFEKYDIVYETQYDVPYEYTTHCAENRDYMVTGTVMFSNHRVFESDETHEAEEGYEWHAVNVTFEFSDFYVDKYRWEGWWTNTDYYNIAGFCNSWTDEDSGTVNFNGIDYDKCTVEYEFIKSTYEFALSHVEYIFYARVPIGYDGTVFAFYDWNVSTAKEAEDACINECANENTIYFRINGDAYSGATTQSSVEQDSSSEISEDDSGCSIPGAVFIEEGVYYVEGLGYVNEEGYVIYYEDPNQYIQIEEGIGNDREYVPNIFEADNEFYKEVIITELQKYYNHIASHCGWPESEYDPGAYIGTQIFIDDIFTYASEGYFYNNNHTGVTEDVLVSEVRYSVFNKTQYNPFANPRSGSYEKILANWINQGCFLIEDINEIYVEILSEDNYVEFDEGRCANLKITVISSDKITYTILMASTLNLETNSEEYVLLDARMEE